MDNGRYLLRIAVGLVAGALLLALTPHAADADPGENPSADYLCTGRAQARHAMRCPTAGPVNAREAEESAYPLPTISTDPDLGYLPFNYYRLDPSEPTWLYSSRSDARRSRNERQAIEAGFDFVSWTDCRMVDGKAIYMIEPDVFIRGGSGCSHIATSDFHGLQFYRTPKRAFAWVLGGTFTAPEPGSRAKTNTWVSKYQLVTVYEETKVLDYVWYRIGPEDWIEQRLLSVVRPKATKPEGVPAEADRWISIDLFEQTISAYQDGELVYATAASTGLPGWWTQPGTFQVYSKLEADRMSGAFAADRSDFYYLQDVPWVLYYDESRAIHGAYWHNGFGFPRSHGCVNLSPSDAKWFYDWAEEGTWVHVYDPSGETPTDPSVYGAGGA